MKFKTQKQQSEQKGRNINQQISKCLLDWMNEFMVEMKQEAEFSGLEIQMNYGTV